MGDRSESTSTAEPLTLVIADDDDTIRDGLREIMDWDRLGFRLVADFSEIGRASCRERVFPVV